MTRYLPTAGVLLAEVALRGVTGAGWGATVAWGLATVLVLALGRRWAGAAFVAALALTSVAGPGYLLLPWTGWQAGRATASRTEAVAVAGAVGGAATAQLAVLAARPREVPVQIMVFLLLVVLPVLAGRYAAQHRRLLESAREGNRRLRRGQEVLAEQERLRERLRIARDMHDSLGHRLSLVSVQAAALEVADLPQPQRAAVAQLAVAARGAMDELYELIGALRADAVAADVPSRGIAAIASLVSQAGASGMAVELHQHGTVRPVPADGAESAYRVVEEGLTNAAKHAPGRPVRVDLAWEPDALLVTVANPCPSDGTGPSAGHGLLGLRERVGLAGGFLDHRRQGDGFRLVAMLPVAAVPEGAAPQAGRGRLVAVGTAAAFVVFGLLQASMVMGVAA